VALPDTSGLTDAELAELQATVAQQLAAREEAHRVHRAELIDPTRVETEIAAVLAMVTELSAWIAAAPPGVQKQMAVMLRRTAVNVVRLMRVTAGLLDSTETDEETL
jgi:hypothetical protein